MKNKMILLLILALLLCGCAQQEAPETQAASETQAAPETQPVEEVGNPFSLGTVEKGVYTNSYMGIGCDFGESWTVYPASELQQLPEDVQAQLESTEIGQAMEGFQQIFDMAAENLEDNLAISMAYVALSPQEQKAFAALTEEETVDATLLQKDMLLRSYIQAGMEVESIEKVQLTFLGQTHWGIRTVAYNGSIPIYMLQVMDYTLGAYGANLTATSYLEDNTQQILDLFQPLR